MKFVLLIISFYIAAISANENLWENFKETHQKVYGSQREENYRYSIFRENLKEIEEHNVKYQKGELNYYLGITAFSDVTQEEFVEWLKSSHNAPNKFLETSVLETPSAVGLPEEWDWRTEEGVITAVPDGTKCNAGFAFSTTSAIEAYYFLKNNQVIKLSDQELVDCCNLGSYNSGCEGGYVETAYQYVQVNGILPNSSYPWRGETESICAGSGEPNNGISIREVKKVFGSDEALRLTLGYVGPVSGSVDGSRIRQYAGGIYYSDDCLNVTDITHGVLVVGYGDGYWLIRNSWDTSWGEEGYMRLTSVTHRDCGLLTNLLYPDLG